MSNVNGIIKSIQDIMRKDVGVDGDAQRISQLVWLFFLKIYCRTTTPLLCTPQVLPDIPRVPCLPTGVFCRRCSAGC